MTDREVDVVVAGAGNAAMCAALAAREQGAEVLILEAAPEAESGGNSRYTAGAMRVVFEGVEDLVKVVDLSAREIESTDFGRYTREQYYDDMARVTRYRCHPDLVETLVENSLDTLVWMRGKGVRFQPSYGRQAFRVDGRFRFWGGLAVETWGGGPGLVENLKKCCAREGIGILHESRAVSLIEEGGAVRGVVVRGREGAFTVRGRAVVLACGGSNRTPSGAPATSAPAGTSHGCGGRASTPGTGSAWRSKPGRCPTGTGRDAMPWDGIGTRRSSGTSRSATASRSTAIPSASW